jgi:DNA-binding winged helix-turn-helix (wHTH) protein
VRDQLESGLSFHPSARRVVRFGRFRADLSDRSLWSGEAEVRLPPRALAILFYLVERPGKVIPKSALLDAGWKDAHVSETSLTEALGLVRQALGDNAQQPEYIQTVHRRGYRFIAPVTIDAAAVTPRSLPDPPAVEEPAGPPVPGGSSPDVEAPAASIRPRTWWIAVAALGAAAAAVTIAPFPWRSHPIAARVTRATLTLPIDQAPTGRLRFHNVLALSPDGEEMVYVGGTPGATRLFARRMDEFSARPIPGTDGAYTAFFSPDGRRIGFFANGALKHVAMEGGEPVVVTQTRWGLGGTWTPDGRIIFAPDWTSGLVEVDEAGGSPRAIIPAPGPASGYRWPQLLPDGDTIIATRWAAEPSEGAIVAISRRRGDERVLVTHGTFGRYLADGSLVFARDQVLMAAALRDPSGTPSAPRPVVNGVTIGHTGAAQFAVSDSGALIYVPEDAGRDGRRLVELDPDGRERPIVHPARAYQEVSVCGDKLAASITDRVDWAVWIGQRAGGALTRFSGGGSGSDPVWRDGCVELAYATGDGLFVARADGSSPPRKIADNAANRWPLDWTPDGSRLIVGDVSPTSAFNLWTVPTSGGPLEPLVVTPYAETDARLSPDGRWLAYHSNETGTNQVYVRPFGRPGGPLQVSTDGGTRPEWSADGGALFYLIPASGDVMAVSAGGDRGANPSAVRRVLHRPGLISLHPLPDGGFLALERLRELDPLTTVNLVINWSAEVRQRLER